MHEALKKMMADYLAKKRERQFNGKIRPGDRFMFTGSEDSWAFRTYMDSFTEKKYDPLDGKDWNIYSENEAAKYGREKEADIMQDWAGKKDEEELQEKYSEKYPSIDTAWRLHIAKDIHEREHVTDIQILG